MNVENDNIAERIKVNIMEYGEVLKVKEQPKEYNTNLVCPICKSSESVESIESELEDIDFRILCECHKCKLDFDVYFSLHYVEHMVFPKSEQ